MSTSLDGGCHCRNIEVRFQSARPVAELAVRECQCSFCRAHGGRSVSDPAGHLTIRVREAKLLSRYRFGRATCDFLLCARCGVYVAPVLEAEGRAVAVLNANTLGRQVPQAGQPVDYDAESLEERRARRLRAWMPCTLLVEG